MTAPSSGRDGHDGDQHAPPAEAHRELVAEHARRQADDAEDGGDGGGAVILADPPGRGRKSQEGHHPGAHGRQLIAMGAIGEDIAERPAVGEDRAEVEQGTARPRLRPMAGDAEERDRQRHQRPQRQKRETDAPAEASREQAGEEEGQADADGIAGGVEGDRARLLGGVVAVGEHPEPRHVGAGKPDARKPAPQQRRPETIRRQSEDEIG